MPHVALVANPTSPALQGGGLEPLVAEFDRRLADRSWDSYDVVRTSAHDGGSAAAREALAGGADLVLVLGGDDTVRAVADTLAGTDVPLGILPAGSTNRLARTLGVPADLVSALRVAEAGSAASLTLARLDDGAGSFSVLTCMGADATEIDHAPARGGGGSWPTYSLTAGSPSRRGRFAVEISLDGAPVLRRQALAVVVGNAGGLASTIAMSDGSTGGLDVCVLAPRSAWQGLTRSRRTATNEDAVWERWRADTVLVRAAERQPRRLDGELIGESSALDASVVPGSVLVRVPAPTISSRRGAAGPDAVRPEAGGTDTVLLGVPATVGVAAIDAPEHASAAILDA